MELFCLFSKKRLEQVLFICISREFLYLCEHKSIDMDTTHLQWLTQSTLRFNLEEKGFISERSYFGEDYFIIVGNNHILLDELRGTPFLLDYTAFVLVTQGEADYTVNLIKRKLQKESLLVMNPKTIYQPDTCSDDYEFSILVFTEELTSKLFGNERPKILWEDLDYITHLDADNYNTVCELFSMLLHIAKKDMPSTLVQENIIQGIINYVSMLFPKSEHSNKVLGSRERIIFKEFIKQVSINADTERSLEFYADKLCISINHLSTTVSRHSGVTAKQWIERAVIQNAKIQLSQTTKSVWEISELLHFPNESFFSKYFKRLTGVTPLQFRNNMARRCSR